jgi:hypothetical protein
MHPMMAVLNRMIFNVDPNATGMAAFNVGASNLMGLAQLKQVSSTNLGDLLAGKTVRTLDVETTSVLQGSQVRQFSIFEMTGGQSPSLAKTTQETVNFASPQMQGLTVMGRNGSSQTMNQFLMGTSTGQNISDPVNFLDESTRYLNHLLDADVVAGHNIFFDLGMMSDTMSQMPGFSKHKNAQDALKRLYEAMGQKDKIVDTLEFSRAYLNNQVNEMLDAAQLAPGDATRLNKFRELIISPEFLARVKAGGSAPYASMEAISLNTNLLDLLYDEAQGGATRAQQVFEAIFQGTHVADTDSALQSYMAHYITTGQLNIVEDASGRSAEVRIAQKSIARSSAVTLTTDISDVDQISQPIFDYIRNDAIGRRGVVLNLEEGVIGQEAGILKFNPLTENYTFSTASGTQDIDEQRASRVIQQTIDLSGRENIDIGYGGKSVNTLNQYGRRISSLGINYTQAHQVNELLQINNILQGAPTGDISAESLLDNIGLTYRKFGGNVGMADMMRIASGKSPVGSTFGVGLSNYGLPVSADPTAMMNAASNYALARNRTGNAYSFMDVRSSIFSTVMSEATSQNATVARNNIVQQLGTTTDDITRQALSQQLENLKYADVQDLLPEFGVSHFKAQKEFRVIRGLEQGAPDFFNRMFIPTETLNEVAKNVFGQEDAFRMGNLSLSFAQLPDGTNRANLFWKLGSDISKDQKKQFIGGIYDHIMNTVNSMSSADTSLEANMKLVNTKIGLESVKDTAGAIDREAGIDLLMSKFEEGGFGYAYEEGETADRLKNALTKLGYSPDNEAIALSNMEGRAIGVVGDIVQVGGMTDTTAATYAGLGSMQQADDAQIQAMNTAAQVIEEKGIKSQLRTRLARSKMGMKPNKMLDFYVGHKTGIRNTALGLIGAGVGYYMYKNYQENKVYDETLEQQEMDSPSFGDPAIIRNPGLNSYRRDPLVTAGVVGNLDRNKIGHTQMGPNKYNHLFGN